MSNGSVQIPVFIYTAVNGYDWQGCGSATAQELQAIVDSTSKIGVGGLRRGVVNGRNGTAMFRHHVRIGGDFAGRDSEYVALAFMPFETIGDKRKVDFARLWNHRLLAQPIDRGRELEDLKIDLKAEGLLLKNGVAEDEIEYKLEAWADVESKPADLLLSSLGDLFQSRKNSLGQLSAKLEEGQDGNLLAKLEFKPFEVVVETANARKSFTDARSNNPDRGPQASAFEEWEKAVGKLKDQENGPYKDILGFRAFVSSEVELLEKIGNEAKNKNVAAVLEMIEAMFAYIEKSPIGCKEELLNNIHSCLDVIACQGPDGDNNRFNELLRKCEQLRDPAPGGQSRSDGTTGNEHPIKNGADKTPQVVGRSGAVDGAPNEKASAQGKASSAEPGTGGLGHEAASSKTAHENSGFAPRNAGSGNGCRDEGVATSGKGRLWKDKLKWPLLILFILLIVLALWKTIDCEFWSGAVGKVSQRFLRDTPDAIDKANSGN